MADLAAAGAGASVEVMEKHELIGGTSAWSAECMGDLSSPRLSAHERRWASGSAGSGRAVDAPTHAPEVPLNVMRYGLRGVYGRRAAEV